MRQKVNWILDLDIRSFFDKLQHEWLVKFVEYRIADKRVVRLIQKWLKAGVMEDGASGTRRRKGVRKDRCRLPERKR
jgi:retron-type reverse transcriptase